MTVPPAIKGALRAVHRLWVEGRTYEEIEQALDAVAALPEAANPEATLLIARERLDFIQRYHPDQAAIERAIQATESAFATQPVGEQGWRLRIVCGRHPALAERYLPPAIQTLEDALGREPGDEVSARTLDALRASLREARGERDEEEEDDDLASSWTPPPEFTARMGDVRRLWRMGWPYEDVITALDELAAMPFSDPGTQRAIAWERFALANVYDRDDEERELVIQRTAPVLADIPVKHRASSIASLCSGRPALAERHIPLLVSELEEELRQRPDAEGEEILAGVKRVLERTRRPKST